MAEILAIIASLLGLAVLIVKRRYSDEQTKKREKTQRDTEFADNDNIAISHRLSNLYDRVHSKKKSGNSSR